MLTLPKTSFFTAFYSQKLCFANRLAGSLPSNFLKIFKNFSVFRGMFSAKSITIFSTVSSFLTWNKWSRNTDEYRMPPRYLSLPRQDAHSAPRPSFPRLLCYNSDSHLAAWVPQRSFSDLWRTTKSWYYVGSRRYGEVMTRRCMRRQGGLQIMRWRWQRTFPAGAQDDIVAHVWAAL